ncbi:MAG: hypothetical protein AAF927_16940 [Bacteroidota bacterium]
MKKILFISLICFWGIACKDQATNKVDSSSTKQKEINASDQSKIGRLNFAVTWRWTTDNVQFVIDNSTQMSSELSELWNQNIVENAYFDTNAPIDKLGNLPNITFFIKAENEEKAKAILNGLTVVKEEIAEYELHPVGMLWLDRNTTAINQKGITGSYVAIWETKRTLEASDPVLKKQSDKMLALWNAGTIENVYFDNTSGMRRNSITDFVFFVNSMTLEQAKVICETLPFFEQKIATYKMYQVGTFWMGRNNGH